MTKITKFDRATCRAVRDEVLEALKVIEDRLGVKIEPERGSYDAQSFYMKLKITAGGEQGAQDAKLAEFNRYAYRYGLDSQDYGAIFTVGRRQYKLVGFLPKGRDNVFLGEEQGTGKMFRLPYDYKDRIIQARKKAA